MTLDLKPQVVAALKALASERGLLIEEYLERHVVDAAYDSVATDSESTESGMVWENGMYVYNPKQSVGITNTEDMIRGIRESRLRHVLGADF